MSGSKNQARKRLNMKNGKQPNGNLPARKTTEIWKSTRRTLSVSISLQMLVARSLRLILRRSILKAHVFGQWIVRYERIS